MIFFCFPSKLSLDLERGPGDKIEQTAGASPSEGTDDLITTVEVSRKYNLSADTLRYYEHIGLAPAIHRSESGIRDCTAEGYARVEFAKCTRGAGTQVETLAEYVSPSRQGKGTTEARKQILIEQRELLLGRMKEMRQTLEHPNPKVDHYEQMIAVAEQKLRRE